MSPQENRAEPDMKTERLRAAQLQAERMLETRKIANRMKTKDRKVTIVTLKDQLATEMKKRQQYILRRTRNGEEIKGIRFMLDSSHYGKMDQSLDPVLIETESRKLDDSLEFRRSYRIQPRKKTRSNRKTPLRYLTSTRAVRRSQSPIALRKKLLNKAAMYDRSFDIRNKCVCVRFFD